MNKICINDHRYYTFLNSLPSEQAGEGRHICPSCAYLQGFNDSFNNHPKLFRPDELLFSQAGTGRHRSALAAYELGYKDASILK